MAKKNSVDLDGILAQEEQTRQATARVTQGWRSRIRERGRLSEHKRAFAAAHDLYVLTLGSILKKHTCTGCTLNREAR